MTDKNTTPNWAELRADFPTLERFVYLDMARKAILPRVVERSMSEWYADISETGGKLAFSMDEIERARQTVCGTFGADPKNLAFIKNTSEGVNIVAQGLDWREGDNVVISTAEHENNTFPWRHLQRRGIEVRIAQETPEGLVSPDAYRALIDKRTRIVSVAWVAYGLGQRADLATYAQMCREAGVLLLVDAIQAAGVLSDRIDSLGGDVVVSGGHKAMFSLAGAGLLYVSDRVMNSIQPTYASKYSFDTLDRKVPAPNLASDAHRYEYGNPNFLGIWVQKRSAAYLASIGLKAIEDRIHGLTDLAIAECDRHGIPVRTPRVWAQRAGIVSVDIGGLDADQVEKALAGDGIRVAAKDDSIRAAVHFYNNEDDVTRFVDRLAHHLGSFQRKGAAE